jgi:PAS domain S-box-containing protein
VAARNTEATSESEAWNNVADALRDNPHDVQFAALYRLNAEQEHAEAIAFAGVEAGHPYLAPVVKLQGTDGDGCSPWIREALRTAKAVELIGAHKLGFDLPKGAWNEEPAEVLFLPLIQTGQAQPLGVLIAGVSRRKRLDENYRSFFNILGGQISKSVSDAQAFEKERKRAEALAEIDRAKTAFFSNVSHEFRTPLTLMLGPLEDTLAQGPLQLGADNIDRLETVHRNGMRLLKLVNSLLDFSRIEAGRMQAVYEAVDLTLLTGELASIFRSAIERAGLYFRLALEPISEPVYVDQEMWEKIVLNLISNAFKFTFAGEIRVALKDLGDAVELSVTDSGTGIPEIEIPRLFERFHRVEGAKGRSFEGSGIGLALVQELVKMHGGSISVRSQPGEGSTFTVSIPTGKAHLAQDRIGASRGASTGLWTDSYVEEAARWLPDAEAAGASARTDELELPLIVLADDNADMRDYAARLLRSEYRVEVANDGLQALELVRASKPDLVLTDVMMPVLDGFGLLAEIRADAEIASVPVVMLSARAGEEARVEGLDAGADDYLVKPFTARELLARVKAHVSMSRMRREAAQKERRLLAEAEAERRKLRELFDQAPAGIGVLTGPDHVWTYVNRRYVRMVGRLSEGELLNLSLRQSLPEIESQGFIEVLDRVYRNDEPYIGTEVLAKLADENGRLRDLYFDFVYQPIHDADGEVEGVLVHVVEVTERVNAAAENTRLYRAAQEELERRRKVESELEQQRSFLSIAQKAGHIGSWLLDFTATPLQATWSEELELLYGMEPGTFGGLYEDWVETLHPDDRDAAPRSLTRAVERHEPWVAEFRIVRQNGEIRNMSARGQCSYDSDGNPLRMIGVNIDITERKRAEDALRNSEKLAATGRLAATIAHEINNPLEAVTNFIFLARRNPDMPETAKKQLELADRELERVSHIAQQTLGFYRDTSSPVRVNIGESVQDVLRLFERKLKYKLLTAELDVPESLEIKGLRGEVRQVLSNLLANAIDASNKEGTIRLRARNVRRNGDDFVRISIADGGHGISPESRQNIFLPFFTTKKDIGTGLGLWVTKSMVEKHGGQILFRSTRGRGTVFVVTFPKNMPRSGPQLQST